MALSSSGLGFAGAPRAQPGEIGRRLILGALAGGVVGFTAPMARAQMSSPNTSVQPASAEAPEAGDTSYISPYALRFTVPQPVLDAGFDQSPWNDPDAEAAMPFATWEAENAHARGAAWGPPARQYPAPRLPREDAEYQRERVLNVAARHIGLAYQHHHLPSWPPPAGWPWLPVVAGENGPGLDCSNFSSFVFNYALGLKLPTGVGAQGRIRRLAGPGGEGCLTAQRLQAPRAQDLVAELQPADLLYFHNERRAIRHVALWLGPIGEGDRPLVIDCSQRPHRDSKGQAIPPGVQIRPFTLDGWYGHHLVFAHRLLGTTAPICQHQPAPFPEGDDRS
jgi:cell wall-associated NlpC family hydrolase